MIRYKYREQWFGSAIKNIANILLIPFMELVASGKDSHWWDWKEIDSRDIDISVKQVCVKTKFPQKRKYKSSRIFGNLNFSGIKDLYITLRVLKKTAVIQPLNYEGYWSLVIKGDYDGEKYNVCRFLQKGKVKCLLDGEKYFLGITEKGDYIPLMLVEICDRSDHGDLLFV